MSLRVAVIGARGRLGSFACALMEGYAGFELVGRYDEGDDWPVQIAGSGALVALEATRAGQGFAHGMSLLEAGVRPVIATSGVGEDELARLDGFARARGLGGLVVPNLSLGAVLMMRMAAQVARHFPDAEIVELHHERKADSPSGTAAETARRIAAGREEPPRVVRSGAQAPERGGWHADVPIHSVRLPGLYAHQEVLFGGAGETLAIRHDMQGPAAFGPGILAALEYAAKAEGVARGLEHALRSLG